MSSIVYQKRTLAFIDILGWKEAVAHKSANELYQLLSTVIYRSKSFNSNSKKTIKEMVFQEKSKGRNPIINPLAMDFEFSIFSDCIVISLQKDYGLRILGEVGDIIRDFLQKGYLVRGGICIGKLYHKDAVIFGPALIKAYKLESRDAVFPRVIIDEKVIDFYSKDESINVRLFLIQDQLGDWIVDPFPKFSDDSDQFYLRHVKEIANSIINKMQELRKLSNNRVIMDKWYFQRELCIKSLEKFENNELKDLINKIKQA